MRKIIFFIIACGILAQGIGTLTKVYIDENEKSLPLQIRKKRVIGDTCDGKESVSLLQAPYVINFRANNTNICTGIILSSNISITAAHCFRNVATTTFTMFSGSKKVDSGMPHVITGVIIHPKLDVPNLLHDLILVRFSPAINFQTSKNKPIKIYHGMLPPNSYGTITSWGCHGVYRDQLLFPTELRSITVPIMDFQQCCKAYKGHYTITDHNICTFYPHGRRRCSDGDSGSPLVVDNHLVGVMSWNAVDCAIPHPDVFINVLHPIYKEWIRLHVPQAVI